MDQINALLFPERDLQDNQSSKMGINPLGRTQ